MSIDLLHNRIRKLKNPLVIDFGIQLDALPPHLLTEEETTAAAYTRFCRELMSALRDTVPGVRFSLGTFSLFGPQGLTCLKQLLQDAKEMGFYVILDAPEILSPWAADAAAQTIFGDGMFPCDALLISGFIGSDAIKPFLPWCKDGSHGLFVVVRSANKSASELQDLLVGSRLVHGAAMETVNRFGELAPAACGYAQIGAVASAGAPESLRNLRLKYNRVFLLADGLDYPCGNAKNCSMAFDRFGYGGAVCAGPSVTCAWKDTDSDGRDYVLLASQAADRTKKNIMRYITIL